MRLAFVDNLSVRGGLSRFSLLLCRSLTFHFPSLTVDYYVHFENLKHTPEIRTIGSRVKVKMLQSTIPQKLPAKIVSKIFSKFGVAKGRDTVNDEIEKRVQKNYDLAYFPSAHMMKRPDISIPVVGTLHDFNWKYFFGQQIFPTEFVEMMDKEICKWMENSVTICSSHDVVNEAKKLYPLNNKLPYVIPIGPVIYNQTPVKGKADRILNDLKINFPYILFPGNFFPHKNHLNLFTAFALLKKRKGFEEYKLVLTGANSDQVHRGIAGERGVQILTANTDINDFDVMGMGYQPNEVIDTLISRARLLVSPSIYEAICTPGMDAWNFGTPTAISDIPPFREHEKAWGIRSAFFNPMDPQNIADVMEGYLNDYEKALADGKISQRNMAKYTWEIVAREYMKVFEKAISSA